MTEMTAAVRVYCDLIDRAETLGRTDLLRQLAEALPRLHAAVAAGGRDANALCAVRYPDYETRFELFSRLRDLLGDCDGYHLEFDAHGQPATGSLADDLTDIYFDLRRGLELLGRQPPDPAAAWSDWRCTFALHWGQHLVDASRHLYGLQARKSAAGTRA